MISKNWALLSVCGLLLVFLVMCFIPLQQAVAGLYWGYDSDNYRDMASVNNLLSGNFSADPSYLGEYRWYNPLLHWMEALIVKVSNIPANVVIIKGGPWLNLLAPVCFFFMMLKLFDALVAVSATAGFLFFISSDMPGWCSATYSPWLYPATFTQFVFYLGIVVLYYAFLKEKTGWFILLGITIGFAFLGHSAPALILILQTCWLTLIAFRNRASKASVITTRHILITRLISAVCFIAVSLPLSVIVIGRYKLKMINQIAYDYADPLFQPDNMLYLVISNLSVWFFIAVAGYYFLIKSKTNWVIKNIVNSWLCITAILYVYVTASKFIRFSYGISLPGIVPSFHFFFYLKAVESVLFGYGFVVIITRMANYIGSNYSRVSNFFKTKTLPLILIILVLAVVINYPRYLKRDDFNYWYRVSPSDFMSDRVEVYRWLINHTDINQVVLCRDELIAFPVMASGRKMVAGTRDHSNPYINYDERLSDCNLMFDMLKGNVTGDLSLFKKYKVSFILVQHEENYKNLKSPFAEKVYTSNTYSVFSVKDTDVSVSKALPGLN